jgi:hypothetical protein
VSVSNPSTHVLRVLGAVIAASWFPTPSAAGEPAASVSYRSAFEGYRAFDASYEPVNWRGANDAVSSSPHELHSPDSAESDRSGHQGTDTSQGPRSPEGDPSPPVDPHAGHRE